jgi:hypothetical protein
MGAIMIGTIAALFVIYLLDMAIVKLQQKRKIAFQTMMQKNMNMQHKLIKTARVRK